eukprot:12179639-Alexandrium_andersonii.AAC.1
MAGAAGSDRNAGAGAAAGSASGPQAPPARCFCEWSIAQVSVVRGADCAVCGQRWPKNARVSRCRACRAVKCRRCADPRRPCSAAAAAAVPAQAGVRPPMPDAHAAG